MLASFLSALDTTILATAMPTVVGELGGLAIYGWVFSLYMIMTAISMPVWGKLSDTLGKRHIFFAAVTIFLLGSMLCGMSQEMLHLILARSLQGIGAGGLASVPFALVSTVFPVSERGKALGFLASTWGIASVLGPLVGSLIVIQLSWRWVFYVNIPLGVASIMVVARHYRENIQAHKEKIDFPGAFLLCTSIVSLLLLFLWMGKGISPASPQVLGALLSFCVGVVLFIRHERVASSPILEFAFFRRRAFWTGNMLGFIGSFAVYGVIAYMPLFAQTTAGGTPVEAGIVITALSLCWSSASVTAGRVVYRTGEKRLVILGMVLMTAGFAMIVFGPPDASLAYLAVCVAVVGLGMGTQTPSLMLTVQHSLEPRHVGVATSTQMLSRTIGGALGVSVMGSAVAGFMSAQFARLVTEGKLRALPESLARMKEPQELLRGPVASQLSASDFGLVLEAFSRAIHSAFMIGMVVVAIGSIAALLLPASSLHRVKEENSSSPGG